MSVVRKSISCFLIIQLTLLGFTTAWDDTIRSDISEEESLRTWILRRLAERVQDLSEAESEQLNLSRRNWVPDAGYTSRGQAGEDVSSKLLAKAFADNPYGPGRRR